MIKLLQIYVFICWIHLLGPHYLLPSISSAFALSLPFCYKIVPFEFDCSSFEIVYCHSWQYLMQTNHLINFLNFKEFMFFNGICDNSLNSYSDVINNLRTKYGWLIHDNNFFLSKFWQCCVCTRLLYERQFIFKYMFVTFIRHAVIKIMLKHKDEKSLPPFLILLIYIDVLQYYGTSSKNGYFKIKDVVIQWN